MSRKRLTPNRQHASHALAYEFRPWLNKQDDLYPAADYKRNANGHRRRGNSKLGPIASLSSFLRFCSHSCSHFCTSFLSFRPNISSGVLELLEKWVGDFYDQSNNRSYITYPCPSSTKNMRGSPRGIAALLLLLDNDGDVSVRQDSDELLLPLGI